MGIFPYAAAPIHAIIRMRRCELISIVLKIAPLNTSVVYGPFLSFFITLCLCSFHAFASKSLCLLCAHLTLSIYEEKAISTWQLSISLLKELMPHLLLCIRAAGGTGQLLLVKVLFLCVSCQIMCIVFFVHPTFTS